MSIRLAQFLILGGMVVLVLACITAAALVWLFPIEPTVVEAPAVVQQFTPVPTFTPTPSPTPLLPTATSTPVPPTASPSPSPTETPTLTPVETSTPSPTAPALASEPVAVAEEATPARPAVDFVVAQQRMRSNAENSWEEVIANGCGSDHTIYVTVVDATGQPLNGVLVTDTYDNVKVPSGSAGLGKLEIELWSNTMSLVVKQDIGSGESYTSEQTLPLSAKDEDIPTEWLFEGGYCASMAECELRQQTNGLCRGHYSYDVIFQRTW